MSRDYGSSVQVRVAATQEQFNKWWPEFVASLGQFKFVGFNCKFNHGRVLKQMKHQGIDPDRIEDEGEEQAHNSNSSTDASFTYSGDLSPECSDVSSLLQLRDTNAVRATVSLIQLSSFTGFVLLVRTCFFKSIPTPLANLLAAPEYYKIGQGLELDVKKLRQTFGVTVGPVFDVRNVCVMWPWFACRFDFDLFGLHSIAEFLFEDTKYFGKNGLSPFYVTRTLTRDQIRSAAEEVQLSVDLFILVLVRRFGLTLSTDWPFHPYMGPVLALLSASLCDKPFLDMKLRPTALKRAANTAAKKGIDKALLKSVRSSCGASCSLAFATLWAWPLPRNPGELCKVLGRKPTEKNRLPCNARPFVAVDLHKLVQKEDYAKSRDYNGEEWMKVEKCIEMEGRDQEGKRYKIRVRVESMDESSFSGGDGLTRARDFGTVFADQPTPCSQFDAQQYHRILTAAVESVPSVRLRHQWAALDRQEQNGDTGGEENWDLEPRIPTVEELEQAYAPQDPVHRLEEDKNSAQVQDMEGYYVDIDEPTVTQNGIAQKSYAAAARASVLDSDSEDEVRLPGFGRGMPLDAKKHKRVGKCSGK